MIYRVKIKLEFKFYYQSNNLSINKTKKKNTQHPQKVRKKIGRKEKEMYTVPKTFKAVLTLGSISLGSIHL